MRNILKVLLAIALLVGGLTAISQTYGQQGYQGSMYEGAPMGLTYLSAAVTTTSQTLIQVNSVSLTVGGVVNITAANPQWGIKIDQEIMRVEVVSGTALTVARGQYGTKAQMHAKGQLVWASPLQWLPPNGPLLGLTLPPRLAYETIPIGSVALSTPVGTNTAFVATTTYCADIYLPVTFASTGGAYLTGSASNNGYATLYLVDPAGNVVGRTASTATGASTNAFKAIAWSPGAIVLPGPADYFLCLQASSASDYFQAIPAPYLDVLTTSFTSGTYGTFPPNWITPRTFTATVGMVGYIY